MQSFVDLDGLRTFKDKLEENFQTDSDTHITRSEIDNELDSINSDISVLQSDMRDIYGGGLSDTYVTYSDACSYETLSDTYVTKSELNDYCTINDLDSINSDISVLQSDVRDIYGSCVLSDTYVVKGEIVNAADHLHNVSNFMTVLSQNTAGSTNGSGGNVSIGVTGILPVTNGGTGRNNLSDVTVGSATKAFNDGSGRDITRTYATKTELNNVVITGGGFVPILEVKTNSDRVVTVTIDSDTLTPDSSDNNVLTYILPKFGSYHVTALNLNDDVMVDEVVEVDVVKKYKVNAGFRLFGYRIKQSEADPYERVEYLYDAVGKSPAHMDFENGVFDYGSWANAWFITNNKPCMLKYDGTVDYYLDPNDYTKKLDGSPSDVANTSYEGNAMAQFPTVWFKRYTEGDYTYELVSDIQLDSDFKAYAHTNANGIIKPYFYHSLFFASGNSSQLRSLAGVTYTTLYDTNQFNTAASTNGTNWYMSCWSQFQLIRTLCILISKSTDYSGTFGKTVNAMPSTASGLYNKGQFFGSGISNSIPSKVFHIEHFCGWNWTVILGLKFNTSDKCAYAKMTPEGSGYRTNDINGYTKTNGIAPSTNQFISKMYVDQFGMLPTEFNGAENVYYDYAQFHANYARFDAVVRIGLASPFSFAPNVDHFDDKSLNNGTFLVYI